MEPVFLVFVEACRRMFVWGDDRF